MLKKDKDLKMYYSIGEVSAMLGIEETTLRFWEKVFPQLKPKKAGRNIRQYRKEDIGVVRLIHHLVKERGMTLTGALRRMNANPEQTSRHFEIVQRLRSIREELAGMRDALSINN